MKNILVIKHGSLGDIVQISGALKDLKNSFTDYKILLLTTPLYQELMSKCPYIDDIILDDRKIKWNPLVFLRLKKKLNKLNFSYVFDFQNSNRTEIYRKYISKNSIWSSSRTILKETEKKSEFDKLAILERFKIQLERSNVNPTYTMQPDFSWAIDNNFWPKEIIPKKYITLLPFCSKHLPHKKWPFYNELISMIRKENKNIEIVIVPGPGEVFEASSFDAQIILDQNQPTNFFQLAKILSESLFVVSNDTGPAHIAAHLGCSGLALFGSHTSSRKVSIKTNYFDVIESKDLNDISVNQVFNKIQLHLQLEDI
jgi:ADP-heptose:LPS heptosyltransferase